MAQRSDYYVAEAEKSLKRAYESDPETAAYNNSQAITYAILALGASIREAGSWLSS